MAHQPHDICWDVAASRLTYRSPESIDSEYPTNFYVLVEPKEIRELHAFAESFARNIEEHTQNERQKYKETYEPPSPDDVIVDDRIARKITPTVNKWRRAYNWEFADGIKEGKQICQHYHTDRITDCGCALPFRKRKASAFFPPGFYNLQLLETLLTYVCSYPDTGYERWKRINACRCSPTDLGWDQVFEIALHAYIGLNIVYCFPELCVPKPHPQHPGAHKNKRKRDYRDTKLYQRMLKYCALSSENEVPRYLHRQFFGIADDHFTYCDTVYYEYNYAWSEKFSKSDKPKRGRISRKNMTSGNPDQPDKPRPYLPLRSDILQVLNMLRIKGLPQELILEVLVLEDYDTPRRILPELKRYLADCWLLMVRCNMFAKAVGADIDWKAQVMECFQRLLSHVDENKK
ncbi:hypothetical protein BO94DRAFT_555062 [Aspergillus sclerotioniger CBS 115572]|uniref:Uncharacterized protein n=1 Tax=Aspergillus sclerotioniger CBS 115572 TaxID=1450535 RepID=A0A317X4L7_9EURO|nr:hypothetical protein BO94DRAFT_555062 [Aspergillus sclerotioniger CBS 115572]PWY91898.1 hypothetical protein BO94DRAFT_555062 [Aspergillus sclerotioniger CBS 115572]